MTSNREFHDLVLNHLRDGKVTFNHSPELWKDCCLPVELDWKCIRFTRENEDCVPQDKYGVYAFMLEPEIPGPPKSAYLLYIGKTEVNRRFRRRYKDYIYHQYSEIGYDQRPRIARLLEIWNGYIWFYYAPIEDINLVEDVETILLNACIPPANDKFKGRINAVVSLFRGNVGG